MGKTFHGFLQQNWSKLDGDAGVAETFDCIQPCHFADKLKCLDYYGEIRFSGKVGGEELIFYDRLTDANLNKRPLGPL